MPQTGKFIKEILFSHCCRDWKIQNQGTKLFDGLMMAALHFQDGILSLGPVKGRNTVFTWQKAEQQITKVGMKSLL
jgi:hypothetical protein